MTYQVADIVKDVRVCLDQNMVSDALAGIGDVDTLALDEIIESKIVNAAMAIESQAPVTMLDSGMAFGDSIGWDSEAGYGSGHIHLPDDFLRLLTFQMSDWDYAVTQAITEDDPLYAQQRSRFGGVRGNPQKPIVAITQQPIGLVLEFYSCTSGDAWVKRARYIPIPRIRNGKIELCEKLKPAIVYYTAYLAALSISDTTLAASMLNTANTLAGIVSE